MQEWTSHSPDQQRGKRQEPRGEIFDLRRFDSVSNPPVWQIVTARIREKLDLGLFLPGERIPSERQLAADFGLARPTIREGVRALQGEGRLEIQRSNAGGALVRRPLRRSEEVILEELRQRQDQLDSIFAYRSVVEPYAVSLAAQNCTPEHLEVLDKSVTNMKRASEALQEATETVSKASLPKVKEIARNLSEDAALEQRRENYIFHSVLAEASADPDVAETIQRLHRKSLLPVDVSSRLRSTPQDTVGEHEAILFAIRDQRGDEAAETMRKHIESTRSNLRQAITGETIFREGKQRKAPEHHHSSGEIGQPSL